MGAVGGTRFIPRADAIIGLVARRWIAGEGSPGNVWGTLVGYVFIYASADQARGFTDRGAIGGVMEYKMAFVCSGFAEGVSRSNSTAIYRQRREMPRIC